MNKKAPTMRPALLATVAIAALLSSCAAPLVLGAAATAGYVGLQDRPSAQVAKDSAIKTRVKGYLTETNFTYLGDVGIDVFYADVLLTGIVPTQADGEQVADVVKRTEGVRKIYNELFVGAEYSTAQKAKDGWIAAQIKPRLIATNGVYPLNYLITVVNSHVYIIGSVQTPNERSHVLHLLRTTKGVTQVHDYLVMAEGGAKADGRINTIPSDKVPAAEIQATEPSDVEEGTPMPALPTVTEESLSN